METDLNKLIAKLVGRYVKHNLIRSDDDTFVDLASIWDDVRLAIAPDLIVKYGYKYEYLKHRFTPEWLRDLVVEITGVQPHVQLQKPQRAYDPEYVRFNGLKLLNSRPLIFQNIYLWSDSIFLDMRASHGKYIRYIKTSDKYKDVTKDVVYGKCRHPGCEEPATELHHDGYLLLYVEYADMNCLIPLCRHHHKIRHKLPVGAYD